MKIKFSFSDSFPLFILVLSLSMALFNPIIRENEVLRVGWAIIHTIIATSYLTGLIILKAIRSLPTRERKILKAIKNHVNDFQYAWIIEDDIGEWYGKLQNMIQGEK